jgi:hypothetical protein
LHAAAPVILTRKSILNLSVDAMEPLLGPVGSFLTSGKLRFQLRDPIFGRVQLMRKLLSHVERTLAVFFGNASRSVEHLQDRLTRLVELIGPVRRVAAGSPRIAPDLTMHRSALSPLKWINLIVWRRSFVARPALCTGSLVVCLDVWPMSNEIGKKRREMKPKPFGAGDATRSREPLPSDYHVSATL